MMSTAFEEACAKDLRRWFPKGRGVPATVVVDTQQVTVHRPNGSTSCWYYATTPARALELAALHASAQCVQYDHLTVADA